MKITAVSKASGVTYRHSPSRSILQKKVDFRREPLSKERITELLEEDSRKLFKGNCKDAKDLILNCGFTSYIGDVSRLLGDMAARKRTDFLVLTYLGKMRNAMRTTYTSCDMSNLIFLNRLNTFARMLQEISGKESKVIIAAENKSFDYDIFRFEASEADEILKQAKGLASEFGMRNIEVRALEEFLGGEEYKKAFLELLEEIKSAPETRQSDEYKVLSNVFMNAVSPPSFGRAVSSYAAKTKAMRDNAGECALRYMAFHRARDRTNFWGRNGQYIRSTVSTRNDVLTFKYEIGRLAPFQGMAVYNNEVGTEFFYDIVYATSEEKATLPLMHYRNAPFMLDIRNGVNPDAFA